MTQPAAWYPDPTGRHKSRFWDGQKWTDAVVRSDGKSAVDPAVMSVPPADGSSSVRSDAEKGSPSKASYLGGCLTIFLVIGLVGSCISWVASLDVAEDEASSESVERATATSAAGVEVSSDDGSLVRPPTTTRPATTTVALTPEELILLDDYGWNESSERVAELQRLIGVTADGDYGPVTQEAHRNELIRRGLPVGDLPAPSFDRALEYVADVARLGGETVSYLEQLSGQLSSFAYLDEQWIFDTAVILVVIQGKYDEALELDPPACYSGAHDLLLDGYADLAASTEQLATAIDTLDPSLVETASASVVRGAGALSRAAEVIDEVDESTCGE